MWTHNVIAIQRTNKGLIAQADVEYTDGDKIYHFSYLVQNQEELKAFINHELNQYDKIDAFVQGFQLGAINLDPPTPSTEEVNKAAFIAADMEYERLKSLVDKKLIPENDGSVTKALALRDEAFALVKEVIAPAIK